MKEENPSKKEEIGGGIFTATFFVTLVLIVVFGSAPVVKYAGDWWNYWNGDAKVTSSSNPIYFSESGSINWGAETKARDDCKTRATKFYKSDEVSVDASSTSPNYSTYDCYGIKYNKIP